MSGVCNPSDEAPRRLRRAEAVLSNRTSRFILVLDRLGESFGQQAVIRTAGGRVQFMLACVSS